MLPAPASLLLTQHLLLLLLPCSEIYMSGVLTSSVTPPTWVIVISACGLVLGLATYGYNVTRWVGACLLLPGACGLVPGLATMSHGG